MYMYLENDEGKYFCGLNSLYEGFSSPQLQDFLYPPPPPYQANPAGPGTLFRHLTPSRNISEDTSHQPPPPTHPHILQYQERTVVFPVMLLIVLLQKSLTYSR